MSMSGYTKLFNSILASTIWREDNATRIVWITLLAMADKHGIAEGSVPGLADFARVSVPACRRALARLSAPDPDSRSQEDGGRRIETIPGGWRLINHAKYREKLSADERTEYNRQKQREHRERQRLSANVSNVIDKSARSAQADADAEATTTTEARTEDQEISSEPSASEPSVLTFPVVGSKALMTWALTQEQVTAWAALYPNLDVLSECRKAAAWIGAHPDRRKTARGMPKFLVGWLNRAVDSLRGAGPITGSLKTAGNRAAVEAFINRRTG